MIFQPDGKIAAIRNSWMFDDMYSAFAVQGLAKDGQLATKEQLAPLAKTNVESLAEFGYFTFAKNAGAENRFRAAAAIIRSKSGRTSLSC